MRAEEADGEYHGAYPYYEDGEEFAELVQLYLERRLVLLRVFERVGYLPISVFMPVPVSTAMPRP